MAGIYFFDDFALDRKINVERRYFRPERFSEEPFVDPVSRAGYPSVHWCPEIGKYRMWYSRITVPERDERCVALAESEDGKRWTLAEDCGSSDPVAKESPNVVFSGDGSMHGASVYRDAREESPDQLYKMIGVTYRHQVHHPYRGDCVIATSGDGVHWSLNEKSMKWSNARSDTCNNLVYNPVREVYQVFHRASLTDRRIHCTHSPDLVHWSDPELLVHPDPFDPPCCQLYGMAVSAFDGIFIGMLWVYHIDMFDPVPYKMCGYVTPELAYSYDGFHWNRTHREVLELPPMPEYGSGSLYLTNIVPDQSETKWLLPASAPKIQHGDYLTEDGEMLLFGTPEFFEKMPKAKDDPSTGAILLYAIRPEGFVGLHSFGSASPPLGNLLFKAIDLLGGHLTFNLSAPLGKVWFQISDSGANPIPGFTFDDCVPFTGDSLAYQPEWNGHVLSELKGRHVRLELKMHSAALFAVHGDFRPHHSAVAQVSYGNPKMAEG